MRLHFKALTALVLSVLMLLSVPAWAGNFTGTVTLVHINDVHSFVESSDKKIGYAQMGGYFDHMRAANPNTLILDAGDVFSGSPFAAIDQGQGFVPALNTLGIDAMTAGNADFVYGSAGLKALASRLKYPVLVGNMVYKTTGEPIFPGLALIKLPNGMTAGIVGVTTPVSAEMGATDLDYKNAIAVLRDLVTQARAKGADMVIGLLHLGDIDSNMNSLMVAEQVKGIDVIVDGHSHSVLPHGTLANGVLIGQTGQFGEAIGVIDMAFANGAFTGATARLVDKDAVQKAAPVKDATQKALEPFLTQAHAYFGEKLGETRVLLDGRRDMVRTQETNAGNLFTDALREKSGADLALLEAGYIGGYVEPGALLREDLLKIARLDTKIVTTQATGAQILSYMRQAVAFFPKPNGNFLQISGGRYTITSDGTKPATVDVTIGDAPLDPDKVYRVAMVGGSIALIGGGKDVTTVGGTTALLEDYVRRHSPLNPQTEGRIVAPAP